MKKTVVTISRQFGCGAHEIGTKLAERLGVPYYDKELILLAAKESGFDEALFNFYDERLSRSFLYSLSVEGYNSFSDNLGSLEDKIFLYQYETIRKAGEKSCVIVGRCADYILDGEEGTVKVFLYADDDYRMKRVINEYGVDEKSAAKEIRHTDKQRAKFYNFYSDKKWGEASTYDLCINVAKIGADNTVDLIADYIDKR